MLYAHPEQCLRQSDWDIFTYSTEQAPSWEADGYWASHEIPRLLWNSKVHVRVYKSSLLVSVISQTNPRSLSHFLKIHFNIIPPPTLVYSKWSLSFRFPHHNPVFTSPLPRTRLRSCWMWRQLDLIFVVPCIMLNSEIIPTRCNNCVYSPETCRVKPLRRINAIVASCWNYFTISQLDCYTINVHFTLKMKTSRRNETFRRAICFHQPWRHN